MTNNSNKPICLAYLVHCAQKGGRHFAAQTIRRYFSLTMLVTGVMMLFPGLAAPGRRTGGPRSGVSINTMWVSSTGFLVVSSAGFGFLEAGLCA